MKKAPGDNLHAYFLHLLYRLRITKQCKAMSEECIIFENGWWKFKSRLHRQLRKPFKGQYAYEWQIGPAVFMWYHWDQLDYLPQPKLTGFHIGLFKVWYDRNWFH